MEYGAIVLFAVLLGITLFLITSSNGEGKSASKPNKSKGKTKDSSYQELSPFLKDVDIPPKIIRSKEKCAYPAKGLKLKREALVYVDIHIGEEGEILEIQLPRIAGDGFDEAAVKHVRTWKFKPAIHKGKRIASWIRVPVRFRLERVYLD